MPKLYFHILPFLIFLVFQCTGITLGADSVTVDRNLSMLRGSWRFIDFHETSTLTFESDSKMIVDHQPYEYMVNEGSIRIYNGTDSTDYTYHLDGDRLTWNFPDGDEKTFRRSGGGSVESRITGEYYIFGDTSGTGKKISFDGDNQFRAISDSAAELKGLYRVEGDLIYFTMPNGTTDEAVVRSDDNDGFVTSIIYHGQAYNKDLPIYSGVSEQPVVDVPREIYYASPLPDPGYPPPSYPLPQGSGTAAGNGSKKATPPAKTVRDFGATRGMKTPRQ
jgi:hypothetical protein